MQAGNDGNRAQRKAESKAGRLPDESSSAADVAAVCWPVKIKNGFLPQTVVR